MVAAFPGAALATSIWGADDGAPLSGTDRVAICDGVSCTPKYGEVNDFSVAAVAYDAEIAALAGLTSAAGKLPYFTGSGTADVNDFPSNSRSLLAAANYAAMRTLLDLEAGTDFYSIAAADAAFQPIDADLTALGGVTSAADKVPYFTGSGTADVADFPSFGRTLVANTTAALARADLGLRQEYCVALSDQVTALTAGEDKATLYLPAAATVNSVRAYVNTAPTGSTIIIDIHEAGSTIMTTNKISIDASEKTSGTATTAATLTDTSIAANAEITFGIDQVGSSVEGKGAVACLDVSF